MKQKEETNIFNFVGKAGNWVVYSRWGRRYLRRRPRPTEKAPTAAVAAQRERMASVGVFYGCVKKAGLYPFWRRAAEGQAMSGYNLLTRANIPAFDADGTVRDFGKLRLAPALLPFPDNLTLAPTADGGWRLAWEVSALVPGASADDQLRMLVMRDEATFALRPVEAGVCRRGDGEAVFRLADDLKGWCHLFVMFCSRTMEKCTSAEHYLLNNEDHGYIQSYVNS